MINQENNLAAHLNKVGEAMHGIQEKFLNTEQMTPNQIMEHVDRFMKLQVCGQFISNLGNAKFPQKIMVPEKKGLIKNFFN